MPEMPETQSPSQQPERQVAFKVPINALLQNQFIQQEGWNPNYIQINEKQVSRVNLVATVIDKATTESLSTLTLDDSTGIIQARVFNEDLRKVTDINIGDPVLLIARPRKYNEQLFLNIEIIKKVDNQWTKIRKIELEKEFNLDSPPQPPSSSSSIEIQETPTQPTQPASPSLNQSGEKILNLVKDLDTGDGADLNQVISSSGLSEKEAQPLIEELIKLGEIYEPKPSKVKILG